MAGDHMEFFPGSTVRRGDRPDRDRPNGRSDTRRFQRQTGELAASTASKRERLPDTDTGDQREHAMILRALWERDVTLAEAAIRFHIQGVIGLYRQGNSSRLGDGSEQRG